MKNIFINVKRSKLFKWFCCLMIGVVGLFSIVGVKVGASSFDITNSEFVSDSTLYPDFSFDSLDLGFSNIGYFGSFDNAIQFNYDLYEDYISNGSYVFNNYYSGPGSTFAFQLNEDFPVGNNTLLSSNVYLAQALYVFDPSLIPSLNSFDCLVMPMLIDASTNYSLGLISYPVDFRFNCNYLFLNENSNVVINVLDIFDEELVVSTFNIRYYINYVSTSANGVENYIVGPFEKSITSGGIDLVEELYDYSVDVGVSTVNGEICFSNVEITVSLIQGDTTAINIRTGLSNVSVEDKFHNYTLAQLVNYEPVQPDIDVDMSSWIITAVGGFMDFQIFPGFSIGLVLAFIMAIMLLIMLLRMVSGG